VLVAAPIRARQLGELPRADLTGALYVRAPAQVGEVAVAEDRDRLAVGDVAEARDLELLAERAEQPLGLGAGDDLAHERPVLGDDLRHLGLDARQVVGRQPHRDVEVVLELLAVVAAADVDLRRRPQPLHRVGHHVLGGVADHLAALGVARRDHAKAAAARERRTQVD